MNISDVNISHPTDRPNFSRVQIGEVTVWFSYETPVAVASPATDYIIKVRKNRWGTTTGKHLNYLNEDKSERISDDEFEAILARIEVTVADPAPDEVQWPTVVGDHLIVLEANDRLRAPAHWTHSYVYGPGTVIARVLVDGSTGLTLTEGCTYK